jgi:hypothetical protein
MDETRRHPARPGAGAKSGGSCRQETDLVLLQEDIDDRRWARHRDQILIAAALVVLAVAVVNPSVLTVAVVLAVVRGRSLQR